MTSRDKQEKEKLVAELDKKGDKIPSMLIRALRDGEVTLFMTMFRQLTNLREILVNRILFEPGGEGLAIACKAIGISKTDFSTIFSLTRMAISKNNRLDNNETEKIIAFYGRISTEASRGGGGPLVGKRSFRPWNGCRQAHSPR